MELRVGSFKKPAHFEIGGGIGDLLAMVSSEGVRPVIFLNKFFSNRGQGNDSFGHLVFFSGRQFCIFAS